MEVEFFAGRNVGDTICKIGNVIAFPSRRDWRGALPLPGEVWEVEECGVSSNGRTKFVRNVRRISTPAERVIRDEADKSARAAWGAREECADRLVRVPRAQWDSEIAAHNARIMERGRLIAATAVGDAETVELYATAFVRGSRSPEKDRFEAYRRLAGLEAQDVAASKTAGVPAEKILSYAFTAERLWTFGEEPESVVAQLRDMLKKSAARKTRHAELKRKYAGLLTGSPSEWQARAIERFTHRRLPDGVEFTTDIMGRAGWSCFVASEYAMPDAWNKDVSGDAIFVPAQALAIVDAAAGDVAFDSSEETRTRIAAQEFDFVYPTSQAEADEYREIVELFIGEGFDQEDIKNCGALSALVPPSYE